LKQGLLLGALHCPPSIPRPRGRGPVEAFWCWTVGDQQVIQIAEIFRTDSAQKAGDSEKAASGKMKFPVKVTFRKRRFVTY